MIKSDYEIKVGGILKMLWCADDVEEQKKIIYTTRENIIGEYFADFFIKSIGAIVEVKDDIENPSLEKIVDVIQKQVNQQKYPEIKKGVVITANDGLLRYVNKVYFTKPFQRGCIYRNKDGKYNICYETDVQDNTPYEVAKLNNNIILDFGERIETLLQNNRNSKTELIDEIIQKLYKLKECYN